MQQWQLHLDSSRRLGANSGHPLRPDLPAPKESGNAMLGESGLDRRAQALPKTPLWDRLAREGSLVLDPDQDSNVKFLRPRGKVLASWRRTIASAYSPERLFARFRYQVDATYANGLRLPAKGKLRKVNLKRGAVLAWNIIWRMRIVSDYRAAFWKATWHALRRGQIEAIFGMGFVAWHLIQFTQEALGGQQNAF
jgi:hypothetical protein